MPKESIITLKTYFETGDKPTQAQFVNLIDSLEHKDDTKEVAVTFTEQTSVVIEHGQTTRRIFSVYNNLDKQIEPESIYDTGDTATFTFAVATTGVIMYLNK